jgi:glycosyltransferase involved in cell wall biosynthesis
MKETLVKFGHPADKIKVIYNFIDKNWAAEKNPPAKEDYLLYFGRLSEEKGIDVLMNALAQAKQKHHLKIMGDGPLMGDLQKMAKSLKLQNQVEFLGFKSGPELKAIVNGARAIVMPSVWLENMPFALMESVAGGQVVVASNIGGFPEVIKDKENGFLFPAGDATALAATLDNLDKFDLKKIRAAAAATAGKFNLPDHYQALLKVYQELM